MARASRVVVLALVMFAMIGMACAKNPAPAPEASADDYEGDDYSVGALTSGAASAPNGVVAAPIGGPVPPGAFDNAKGGLAPSAASSSLAHFSAVAGASSAALAGFFYF